MPKKSMERAASNDQDGFVEVADVNERILQEVHVSYLTDQGSSPSNDPPAVTPAQLKPGEPIMDICRKLGISCIAPRRKINVMIVGNHSAGKSSYINWYMSEHVQTTAVAIETQGFTFCTSGKKRDTLKGQATMQLFPHLHHDLKQFAPEIYNGLQTEISTSKERAFNLVTFIDTPGLVDGSFHYPFPVEDVIVAIAKHTDLIYIFFDPIGQALCDRTMNVIKRLNQEHAEKIRYFLSKADTVPNERDRQKVVVQITQNLSSRIQNKHAFELPSLYIPDKAGDKGSKIDNILESTCDEMQSTISQNVQNNLNKMEVDCRAIGNSIDTLLADDAIARHGNRRAFGYGFFSFFASLHVLIIAAAYLLHVAQLPWWTALTPHAPRLFGFIGGACDLLVAPADGQSASGLFTPTNFLAGIAALFVVLQGVSKWIRRYHSVYTSREVSNLRQTRAHVMGELLDRKKRLYKLYLDQCSSEYT